MAECLSRNDYRAMLKEFRIVASEQVLLACEEVETILNAQIEQGKLDTITAARCKALARGAADRAFAKVAEEIEHFIAAKGGSDDH